MRKCGTTMKSNFSMDKREKRERPAGYIYARKGKSIALYQTSYLQGMIDTPAKTLHYQPNRYSKNQPTITTLSHNLPIPTPNPPFSSPHTATATARIQYSLGDFSLPMHSPSQLMLA
ncbi:hypothetical protein ACJBU6_10411 [Exserohilum turcicum]